MEYVKYIDLDKGQWNNYIEQMSTCTFDYTEYWIDFCYTYSKDVVENESFLVIDNAKVIGIASIFIEKNAQNIYSISWNGGYCLAPFVDPVFDYKTQEKYIKKIMLHIDEIAAAHHCKSIRLRQDPLCNPNSDIKMYNYNYLMKYQYIDQSSLTQILDLRKDEKELFSDIRKGHKSDIKRGEKYEIEIYDKTNMKDEMIHLYREIYELDAGRVTRNSELFEFYLDFIKNDSGAIAFAKKDQKYVATLIVTLFENTAYYSSYAELTDQLDQIPVGHVMQWKIIQYLKNRNIQYYEMGEQVFGKTHYSNPDQKLINISNYKRGFGGYTVPFYRGYKEL